MSNINSFIVNVESSRKRTGIIYCSSTFGPVILELQKSVSDIEIIDCCDLYNGSLTFSASELLNNIEKKSNRKPSLITNMETFIVSNSFNYSEQVARLLIIREPIKPLFFLFYSKKIFVQFKNQYELKELNQQNILEL